MQYESVQCFKLWVLCEDRLKFNSNSISPKSVILTIFVLNINSTIIKLRLPILALNSRRRLALWFYGRFGWIVSVIFRILDWIWFIHWYNDFPVGLCIEYLRSIDWENLAFGVWDCNLFVSFSAQKNHDSWPRMKSLIYYSENWFGFISTRIFL